MRIEIEMVDGFLLSLENGGTAKARVARVRWQLAPRKPWKVANIIVEEERPSLVVQAVSIYLMEQEQS